MGGIKMQDFHRPALYPVPGAKLLTIFVHGFLGGPGQFTQLVRAVNEAGFAAETLLLPGHGKKSWDFAHHSSREWQETVNEALKLRLVQYEKVVLMGHSMGGLLCINASIKAGPAHGLVLWETPVRLRMKLNGIRNDLQVAFLPERLQNTVAKAYRLASNVRFSTPLGYLLTVPRALDLLRMMAATERELTMIQCPVLLIQSDSDEIVHPVCMERLQKGLANAKVSTLALTSSWHSYFPEDELQTLQLRLAAWLKTL
jgi:carboxylesterase